MRESRTRSIPLPIRYRNRVGLTRSMFRSARCEKPFVTFALIPRAASLNLTARSERPRRYAIFFTGSEPAWLNNFSSSAEVHGVSEPARTA
jgi:hypothetical protein